MTVRILSITGLTLLVLTAVAGLPALLARPEPRARPSAAASDQDQTALLVVRSRSGNWFLQGRPISADSLAGTLTAARSQGPVRFLPSDALATGQVSASLAWLRRHSREPVRLELPPRGQ
jgi:hypothetical protein